MLVMHILLVVSIKVLDLTVIVKTKVANDWHCLTQR